MTAEEWLTGFAEEIGAPAPDREQMDEILRLAAIAAHASERIAAPIACWLVGRAGLAPLAALTDARAVAS